MRYSLGQLSRGLGNRIESGSGVLDNFEQSEQENENGSGKNNGNGKEQENENGSGECDGSGDELDNTNGSEDSELDNKIGPCIISQKV